MKRCGNLIAVAFAGLAGAAVHAEPVISEAFVLAPDRAGAADLHQARLRGTLRLDGSAEQGLHQLSGLAWDADEDLLYALSDDAYVVHLRVNLRHGQLHAVNFVGRYPLRDAAGVPLSPRLADSEGLVALRSRNAVRADTELVVSFEGPPRIARYTADGHYLGDLQVPAALANDSVYRSRNAQLEALAHSPVHGLLTAPERSLRGSAHGTIPIVALADGREWIYPLRDRRYGAVVGMETLPGGDLLILERRFISLLMPFTISLRRAALGASPALSVSDVFHLDTSAGWSIDNFEGLAHHAGSCYFIISDDNAAVIQRTLLSYVEVTQSGPISAQADAASVQPGCTDGSGSRAGGQ